MASGNVASVSVPAKPPRGKNCLVKDVVYDGYDYGVLFQYFKELPTITKKFPYDGFFTKEEDGKYHRYWRFNRMTIDDLGEEMVTEMCAASKGAVVEDWKSVLELLRQAKCEPVPDAFTKNIKETIYALTDGSVAIVGTYHSGVKSICRDMEGRWLPPMRAWKIPNASAAVLKNNLVTELHLNEDQITIAEGVFSILDDAFSKQADAEKPGIHTDNNAEPEAPVKAIDGDNEVYLAVVKPRRDSVYSEDFVRSLLGKYKLYPFQQEGVVHLATSTSAALFDDMGLGKTRQAVVAADIVADSDDDMILVVCPAGLIINWAREIEMICPGDIVSQQEFTPTARWIVTNYERLEEMIAHAGRFKLMITDEAHLLKEAAALRTQYAFEIGSKIEYRFILTGTPLLNREIELHTLLRLSGHPLGEMGVLQFQHQFAGNSGFRSELNKAIGEWMLRRKKDVVLAHLKGKAHQVFFVNPAQERRAQYDALANDSTLFALPKIGKMRALLELIKVDSVMEMVAEMGHDDKFLIFCEFKETVAEFKRQFEEKSIGVVTMIGGHTATRRQKAVDAFQSNPDVRAFVGTTAAAGVGWTLTAANYVIFASLPWTPALKDQAEDRAYRIGQERLVMVKIPLLENSIDVDLWNMLCHKSALAADVLDPESVEQIEAAAEAAFAIAWAKRPSTQGTGPIIMPGSELAEA